MAGVRFLDDLWCPDGMAARLRQRLMVMSAIATNDIGNLALVAVARAREALVVVGVTGQERMRPDADLIADLVNLGGHIDAPAVLTAGCVGRMVIRKEQGALITFRFHAGEGGPEKGYLAVADRVVRDHAGVFQRVAVE